VCTFFLMGWPQATRCASIAAKIGSGAEHRSGHSGKRYHKARFEQL
jgi:hypothetical protein